MLTEVQKPLQPAAIARPSPYISQDDEHPELSAAVKLKIGDILGSEDEATRAAAVRDVERSALQVHSVLECCRGYVLGFHQSAHNEHFCRLAL